MMFFSFADNRLQSSHTEEVHNGNASIGIVALLTFQT